jgi:hypothetical protein
MKLLGRIVVLSSALVGIVHADQAGLRVHFAGENRTFTPAELARMPHTTVTAYDGHEKKSHSYSGVAVHDLLTSVGVPSGEKFRGRDLALVVLAKAQDGYTVAFALAEFDANFSDRSILLVDRQDGAPNPPGIGPLRLVAPGDKRPARWTRMLTELDVVPAAP